MLPKAQAVVTEEGIGFNKLRYASQELNDKGWFVNGKSFKQQIIYDPRCMNYVYVKDQGDRFIPCQLLPSFERFENKSLEEIKMIQFDEDVQEIQYRSEENQAFADLDAQLTFIEIEETEKTNAALRKAGTTDAERQSEIKESRRTEKNETRIVQAFVPQIPEIKIAESREIYHEDEELANQKSIFELLSELSEEEDEND
nr:Mu transposase C-terminal domain-containing protein [Paenibacillus alba]